jgi:hypothetical protein
VTADRNTGQEAVVTDHAAVVRERVSHIARGCRGRGSHDPYVYLVGIEAALSALEQELADANEYIRQMLHDKDEDVQRIVDRAEAAEAEVRRLREALDDLIEYAGRMPGYSLHPQTERARAVSEETE